jgi:hypothetical protein
MENWAIPYFGRFRLAEVEPPDVRAFVAKLEAAGLRAERVFLGQGLAPRNAAVGVLTRDLQTCQACDECSCRLLPKAESNAD